jgi:predicted permease
MWQAEYGGRNVIGEPLQVHNMPTVIVGVAPRGFVGIWDQTPPAVYVPITTFAGSNPSERDRREYYTRYNWGWMDMMVRRKPGISEEAASRDLSQAHVRSWDAMVLQQSVPPTALSKPSGIAGPIKTAAGPDPTVEAKTVKWVSGIALIVLLIACSNVANLFLARAIRRRRETAVRVALGVGRRRLMAQWFTESLLLALIGCVAGVLIAQWGGAALRRLFVGATGAPIPVSSDLRTLALSIGLAIIAALLTGVAPALIAGRFALAESLKSGVREGTHHRSPLRTGLLVFQITMSVVLLVGAGLFVRSFSHVRSLRLGYDADPVVLVSRNLRGASIPDSQLIALHERILETAKTIPGVKYAAMVSSIPFWSTSSTTLVVPGIDSTARLGRFTYQTATPDYFKAMGTRIVSGRPFTEQDREGTTRVAVVSQAMANVLWPRENPIGKLIRVGSDTAAYTTVIGVAEDAAQQQLQGDDRYRYYMPAAQFRIVRAAYLITQVSGDPSIVGETIRKTLQPLMPGQGYITTRPMRDLISAQQRAWRFGATMFVAFGGLALIVAAIGLYGVIGYGVAQRMHEMGVRVALGAQGRDLMRLVMLQAVRVVGAGVLVGGVIAWALGGRVQPLLFEQSARDPLVFAVVGLVLIVAAVSAGLAPARRAARVDPTMALRSE